MTAQESVTGRAAVAATQRPYSQPKAYYLYLPGGFPDWARTDDQEAIARLKRHPRLGVYEDFQSVIEAYDQAKREALERIRGAGRPNLEPTAVRRLTRVHLRLVA